MATVVSLTVVKKFTYRGNNAEEWSNKYYLTGGVPADNTAWKALADALIAQERNVYRIGCVVVRAYGYNDDTVSPNAVWSYDYAAAGATVAGAMAAAGNQCAGDQAAVAWWKTDRLNSKGKAIYLRKYFHAGDLDSTTPDNIHATWATALDALATKLADGSFLDARTLRSRTHADTILSHGHIPYITTRTLKRRGKRP